MALSGALAAGLLLTLKNPASQHTESAGFGKAIIQVILINLVIGFAVSGIDQAAHVGGLISGFFLGLAIGLFSPELNRMTRFLRIGLASILVCGFIWVGLHAKDWNDLEVIRRQIDSVREAEASKIKIERDDFQALLRAEEARLQLLPPVKDDIAQGRILEFSSNGSDMALSEDERTAYIVDSAENKLYVFDITTGNRIQEVSGPALAPWKGNICATGFCVGHGAASIAILHKQKIALIPSMHRDSLAVVDLKTGSFVKIIAIGSYPGKILVTPDQSRAFIDNEGSSTVSVVDLSTLSVMKTWVLTGQAGQNDFKPLALNASGNRLIRSNTQNNQVELFDAVSLNPIVQKALPRGFYRITPDLAQPEQFYGMLQNRIILFSSNSIEVKRYWSLCEGIDAFNFAISKKSNGDALVAIADRSVDYIRIANLDSGITLGLYPIPSVPVRMLFSKDGTKLFALGNKGTLSIIDISQRVAPGSEMICASPSATGE